MTSFSALPPTTSTPSKATSTADNALAVSSLDFLKLLVAQSQNQDPLTPGDPKDTLQQLAALAQVSGLQDIKKSLEQLFTGQKMAFDAASWIGRSALVPSTTAAPLADGSYAGEVSVESADAVDVSFSDASGAVVHVEHIAGPIRDRVGFHWNGLVNGAPTRGVLKVSATAAGVPASVAVWTPVESVRMPAQAAPVLETALGSFAPATVLDLR